MEDADADKLNEPSYVLCVVADALELDVCALISSMWSKGADGYVILIGLFDVLVFTVKEPPV